MLVVPSGVMVLFDSSCTQGDCSSVRETEMMSSITRISVQLVYTGCMSRYGDERGREDERRKWHPDRELPEGWDRELENQRRQLTQA